MTRRKHNQSWVISRARENAEPNGTCRSGKKFCRRLRRENWFCLLDDEWTKIFTQTFFLTPTGFTVGGIGGFGVTAGAHRLWCHRAYKANLPLRICLMLAYCTAGQVRDMMDFPRPTHADLSHPLTEYALRLGSRPSSPPQILGD
jgi:hypothetical protein